MNRSYACPLCGTVLSASRFAEVMKQHRGMERQLEKLKEAERRANEKAEQARKQMQAAAAKAKKQADQQLEAERRRSADKLKKYETNAKTLRAKIDELEDRIRRGETAQSDGLLEERALLAFLKAEFDGDSFAHPGKGGDILQEVRTDGGERAGLILYEVKKVAQWSGGHLTQCAEARVERGADIAVLVTNRFPSRKPHFFVERDVLVISPLGLLPVVHTAREGLLNAHGLRASGKAKERAVRAVYDYLAGGQYSTHIRRIAQHLSDLEKLYKKEIGDHQRTWKTRLGHYRGLTSGFGAVHDTLRGLLSPVGDGESRALGAAKALLPAFGGVEVEGDG